MRRDIEPEPKLGDIRIKIKFAWLPTKIENKMIWLEKYKSVQGYERWYRGIFHGYDYYWSEVERRLLDRN